MYTILVNDDNTLQTSVRKRILQGSSNVDYLHILVTPTYGNINISELTAILTYILPESKTRNTITLAPSEELYKDRIEYKLVFNEHFTSEVGDIKCWVSFKNTENTVIRKTTMGVITILPVEKSENEENIPTTTSIDNIYLDKETNELYLTSNGMVVGDKISLDDLGDTIVESTSNEGLVTVITE